MKKETWRRGLICVVLIAVLTLEGAALCTARAAVSFSDVEKTDYFYTELNEMAELGVVGGVGDGRFLPHDPVKNAEALKLVCGMAGADYAGYSDAEAPWYADVFAWAQSSGVVSDEADPGAVATREEVCRYIVSVYRLPTETATDAFSDTDSKAANVLFDLGVLKGVPNGDGSVSFRGEQPLKRCDACILLSRLNRTITKPDWSRVFVPNRSHYAVSRPAAFKSFSDYVDAWRYMFANLDLSEDFAASGIRCTKAELGKLLETVQNAFYFAMFDYMEYASFLNQWQVRASYSLDGAGYCVNPCFSLSLSNGGGLTPSAVSNKISAFKTACENILSDLYQSGALKNSMTVKEKARAILLYTVYNTKYDTTNSAYTGYDAAVRKTAVCQGYTAMYNYLCNLAGIRMVCMTGTVDGVNHAWSRVYCDGVWYNVDATWCDPVPDRAGYCDESWFWVTDGYLKTGGDARTFDSDYLSYG